MKKSRYTEEQIIAVLKEADAGMKVQDLCRKHGISDVTFYKWRSKYGGLEIPEARCLKTLEEENRRLKHIVADQALDLQALKLVVSKKWLPVAKREAAGLLQQHLGLSKRRSCRVLGVSRSLLQYTPRPDRNTGLRARLKELAEARRRFGSPRLHVLLRREGWTVNHKRVERFSLDSGFIKAGSIADSSPLVQRPHDMSLSNSKTCALLGRKLGSVNEHIEGLLLQEQSGLAQEIRSL